MARAGALRAVVLLAAGVAVLSLGRTVEPGRAQTVTVGTGVPTVGTVRVAALRLEFIPDQPPAPPVTNPPTAPSPTLPATRFTSAENDAYFRNVLTKVRDYYREVSYGKLDLAFTLGPVVAERDYTKDEVYYGNANQRTLRTAELLQTAITQSEGAGFNFAQTDLVLVFHAGKGAESDFAATNANLILSTGIVTPLTATGKTFQTGVLQAGSELQPFVGEDLSIIGRTCMGIATALGAVRTGAGLGAPGDQYYAGFWDLMDQGWMLGQTLRSAGRTDWSTPAHINPAEKIRMGWLTPNTLTKNLPGASIPQVETNSANSVYRMWTLGQVGPEYFLVENRQTVGFDAYLPGSGLLIWHINEGATDQSNPQALRVSLLQADGLQELEGQTSAGDAGDPFPGLLSVKLVNGETTPNTDGATGADTNVSVSGISASSQVMTANLYITPPMILTYKPNPGFKTESVTPTFRASFADTIDPTSITLSIDGQAVVNKDNFSRYYDPGARELVFKSSQLSYGQHVYAIDVQDISRLVSESTGNLILRVEFRTVGAGLRMVSVPYTLQAPDNVPGVVFGAGSVSLARWNAPKAKYVYYPASPEGGLEPPPDDTTRPGYAVASAPAGLAYWIKLNTSSPVRITGDQLEDRAYAIPAFPGWNMIGNPFTFPVDWSGVLVEYQGVKKTLEDAIEAEWISPTLYTYGTSGYTWQTAPNGQLYPWEGYWVKVKVSANPVTLWVPPVQSGIGSLRTAPATTKATVPGEGWAFRIAAVGQGGSQDTRNFVGVNAASQDGADRFDVEEPPAPGAGAVSVRIVENGRSLAQDLRSPEIGTGKTWEFEVSCGDPQERVTLSWPDLGQVPANLEVSVQDVATGRQVYCRTRGGYSFSVGDAGSRLFRLTVAPRRSAPLSVTGLSIQRTRGVSSVRFSLSREASVQVEVVSPATGRPLRRLVGDYAGVAGINSVSGGRSDDLAAGIYLLQVTATASDGVSVRAVQPYVVTR